MDSSPTLQDFILNLIYDPGARSAFELDPHSTLDAAGLGDVTAADVQDVLPLVLDYAPLANTSALDGLSPVDDLTTGVAHLDVAGAVAHLQAITAGVTAAPSYVAGDLNLAAAGTITVTADHLVSGALDYGTGLLSHTGAGLADVSVGAVAGGLDVAHDPAASLDASVTTSVEHTVADVTYSSDAIVSQAGVTGTLDTAVSSAGISGTLDATVNTVTGVTGSLGLGIDDLDVAGVHEATSSIVGAVPVNGLLPDGGVVDSVTSTVDHHVSSVTGLVGGSAEPAPETDPGLLGGLTGLHF
ncbi:IniB N-terminal domain-containing protein [Actinoplanes sp. GCM10030250]|uniref:IniB N-terminal domain-containing protein n=1 Tax=Actinoplanes sp. GCM10030250 TaxID=3273376 RepID=UPI00360C8128